MKIIPAIQKPSRRLAAPKPSGGGSEDGSATLLFIALLAIMLLLVTANIRTLMQLRIEEKLVEQKQIQRLNPSLTNAVSTHPREAK